jgi:hypothetical protein
MASTTPTPEELALKAFKYSGLRLAQLEKPGDTSCRHVFPSGRQCRAFRLKDNPQYCYYHQAAQERRQRAAGPLQLQNFEDCASVQDALNDVVQSIVRDRISDKKAHLLLQAMKLSLQTLRSGSTSERLLPGGSYDPSVRELEQGGDNAGVPAVCA